MTTPVLVHTEQEEGRRVVIWTDDQGTDYRVTFRPFEPPLAAVRPKGALRWAPMRSLGSRFWSYVYTAVRLLAEECGK